MSPEKTNALDTSESPGMPVQCTEEPPINKLPTNEGTLNSIKKIAEDLDLRIKSIPYGPDGDEGLRCQVHAYGGELLYAAAPYDVAKFLAGYRAGHKEAKRESDAFEESREETLNSCIVGGVDVSGPNSNLNMIRDTLDLIVSITGYRAESFWILPRTRQHEPNHLVLYWTQVEKTGSLIVPTGAGMLASLVAAWLEEQPYQFQALDLDGSAEKGWRIRSGECWENTQPTSVIGRVPSPDYIMAVVSPRWMLYPK